MALYRYTARDAKGVERHGSVDARTKDLAISLLRNRGLYVVSLSEKKESLLDQLLSFKGIPKTEVVSFTRQFSTMLSAGLPISRALDVLATQTENTRFKHILFDVLSSLEGGASLAVALGRYPDVFPPTYQALIGAGEASGKLDIIMKRLADTLEAERELNSRFKGAMIYPAIVFLAMIGVFIILMVFVVPKLAVMYEGMNIELPVVTRVMISTSNFMVDHLIWILLGLAGVFLGLRSFAKSEEGHYIITEVVFRMPIFGRINRYKELGQFTRTLALLMSSAIPIVDALKIVGGVVSSLEFKKAAEEAASQVEKGRPLSDYFKSNRIFPPVVGQMASVGEETGKMDEVLDRVSSYYDGELDIMIKGLSSALEPIIIVMLGAMVGFLIISIIVPIYKITNSI